MDNRILYLDEHIAVVIKNAGEVCESAPDKVITSAQNAKSSQNTENEPQITDTAYLPEQFATVIEERLGHKPECIECVHRLDRPVSGVAVLGLDKRSVKVLSAQFASHDKVRKIYWAVVEGVREKDIESLLLSCFMVFNPSKKRAYIVDENARKAKKAELRMQCMGHGDRYSFVKVELLTGRTHQIRIQLSKEGMPIKGDVKYGARRADTLPGIRLFSHRIDFVHPITRESLTFSAPIPASDPLWVACEQVMSEN